MIQYNCIVDWLTFTIPYLGDSDLSSIQTNDILDYIAKELPQIPAIGEFYPCAGAGIYKRGIRNSSGMQVSFCGTTRLHISLSGQMCQLIRDCGQFDLLLPKIALSVSRCDLALDLLCDTTPLDAISAIPDNGRQQSRTSITSQTGNTEYIGSPKSDRFMRVYRYNPPHPRSDYLRYEFVNRRDTAQTVVLSILENGYKQTIQMLLNSYNIPIKVSDTSENMTLANSGGRSQKTLFWLCHQVAPAIKRLVKDGTINDLDMFVDMYFRED